MDGWVTVLLVVVVADGASVSAGSVSKVGLGGGVGGVSLMVGGGSVGAVGMSLPGARGNVVVVESDS